MAQEVMTVVVTATKGLHAAVPGRYARVAVRPITDYEAVVNGTRFTNRNKAEIQAAIRSKLRRGGYTGRVSFEIREAAQ